MTGWDQVDRVEVLKNNRVIHRDFPMDRQVTARVRTHDHGGVDLLVVGSDPDLLCLADDVLGTAEPAGQLDE